MLLKLHIRLKHGGHNFGAQELAGLHSYLCWFILYARYAFWQFGIKNILLKVSVSALISI